MNYNKIIELAEMKGLTARKIIEGIGISPAGFYKMIENHTMSIKNLEKISEFLEVDPIYFFEGNVKESYNLKDSVNISNSNESKVNYNKNFFSKEEQKYKDDNTRLMHENALLRHEVSKLKDKIIELLEKK